MSGNHVTKEGRMGPAEAGRSYLCRGTVESRYIDVTLRKWSREH